MIFVILSFANEGEKNKFEYIYNRYKNLLLKRAYSILHDYMLAEDAVSEAFLRIYKNLHKIDDPDSNKCIAFLVTIARNVAITLLNKKTKNSTEELSEEKGDAFSLENYVLSEIGTEEILRLINNLTEDHKTAFLLKYAYDYSNQEIGKLLNINANHVGVLLHRAKKKMATMLKEEGFADAKA